MAAKEEKTNFTVWKRLLKDRFVKGLHAVRRETRK